MIDEILSLFNMPFFIVLNIILGYLIWAIFLNKGKLSIRNDQGDSDAFKLLDALIVIAAVFLMASLLSLPVAVLKPTFDLKNVWDSLYENFKVGMVTLSILGWIFLAMLRWNKKEFSERKLGDLFGFCSIIICILEISFIIILAFIILGDKKELIGFGFLITLVFILAIGFLFFMLSNSIFKDDLDLIVKLISDMKHKFLFFIFIFVFIVAIVFFFYNLLPRTSIISEEIANYKLTTWNAYRGYELIERTYVVENFGQNGWFNLNYEGIDRRHLESIIIRYFEDNKTQTFEEELNQPKKEINRGGISSIALPEKNSNLIFNYATGDLKKTLINISLTYLKEKNFSENEATLINTSIKCVGRDCILNTILKNNLNKNVFVDWAEINYDDYSIRYSACDVKKLELIRINERTYTGYAESCDNKEQCSVETAFNEVNVNVLSKRTFELADLEIANNTEVEIKARILCSE
ncbi:MAG TPA: hypothetical protein VJ461_01690 [Candidatus Nanoarchaeia archaeon]|nr:hypothetical protein [Candidatus Nanoarchaeia archaeon]